MEGGVVKTRPLRPLEAVRAFGMMLGGSIALAVSAAASIAAVARAVLSLRLPPPLALVGMAATALYAFVIRPWHLRWGAEPEDEKRVLPAARRFHTLGASDSKPIAELEALNVHPGAINSEELRRIGLPDDGSSG